MSASNELQDFFVDCDNYQGPFDVLLDMIANNSYDITELGLSAVTDEFIAYTKELPEKETFEKTTAFLVVASTLLEIKTFRLIASNYALDEYDHETLRRKDIFFAKLLEYKAYRDVATLLAQQQNIDTRMYPRSAPLPQQFITNEANYVVGEDIDSFGLIAAHIFAQQQQNEQPIEAIHRVYVSVAECEKKILLFLSHSDNEDSQVSFTFICAGVFERRERIGMFLAILNLYQESIILVNNDDAEIILSLHRTIDQKM